jgi:hypothetical protein
MTNKSWFSTIVLAASLALSISVGATDTSEAGGHDGFKLSSEALKNFELKVQKLQGYGPWPVSKRSVLHSGEETNLYRLRDGFFKRIDFQVVKKSNDQLFVASKDLRDGDEVVVSGLGFLRIAELAAFGGVSESHSH